MSRISRVSAALDEGVFALPTEGLIAVVGPGGLPEGFPKERIVAVTRMKPEADAWQAAGVTIAEQLPEDLAMILLRLPQAKRLGQAWLAESVATGAKVVVDGDKTAGIESLIKALKKRCDLPSAFSKAHGKVITVPTGVNLSDWRAEAAQVGEFCTYPGVFSADAIDPASQLLANASAGQLSKRVVDLGAGWGYLTARALQDNPKVTHIDLVEANGDALDCARRNVDDARVEFHWADALTWLPADRADAVIMNPPFHAGRAGDPGLGQSFIARAATLLTPRGTLWMVCNRHLPYEAALARSFASVQELGQDPRFKLFRASKPKTVKG